MGSLILLVPWLWVDFLIMIGAYFVLLVKPWKKWAQIIWGNDPPKFWSPGQCKHLLPTEKTSVGEGKLYNSVLDSSLWFLLGQGSEACGMVIVCLVLKVHIYLHSRVHWIMVCCSLKEILWHLLTLHSTYFLIQDFLRIKAKSLAKMLSENI